MLFSFYFLFFFILKGAPAPSFYLGTPDGGNGGWLILGVLLILTWH